MTIAEQALTIVKSEREDCRANPKMKPENRSLDENRPEEMKPYSQEGRANPKVAPKMKP